MQESDYQIEPELRQGPPRKVRFKPGMRKVRFWIGLLVGLLLGLTLLLAVVDLQELTALHNSGITTTAHVTGKATEEHQGSQNYLLDFAFEANGRSYRGSDRMTQSDWWTKQEGSPIPLVYLPSNPNVHRIGTEISAGMVQNRWHFWIGLGGITLVVIGGMSGSVEATFRRERAMLRDGVAVPAAIVSGTPLVNSPTAARRVTFRYRIATGETRTKTVLLTAMAANRLAGRVYVTALYDPGRPARTCLYPLLQTVEIA